MEKAIATPDYHPLSLNALTNACSQKSNRAPVVDWNEQTVEDAVDSLQKKALPPTPGSVLKNRQRKPTI
jgi:uncharacterized protein YceH (UPF0502 family)